MEIKEIPIPTMPDWLKLYNTYDPEYYAPGKRVSAEEWNTLFLASVRQGNYNADTLELLIKTYLPETYLTQTDFSKFSTQLRTDFVDVTKEVNSLEERVVKAEDVAYSLDDVVQEANRYAKQADTKADEAVTFAQNAGDTSAKAKQIAQEALKYTTEIVGSQVFVGGKQVSVFNADTKADLDHVDKQIAALIGAAPETLNTLEEVAKAIEENETVVDALNSAIGTKANKADIEPTIQFAEAEKQKSKNLFNVTKAEPRGYSWQGVPQPFPNDSYISCGYIKIKPNTNYIFSLADSTITMRYTGALFYTVDKTYIGYDECNKYTFKTPSNAEYMICQFWFESDPMNYKDIIQIEEGSAATEFQPYNGVITHNGDAPIVFSESERQKSKNLFNKFENISIAIGYRSGRTFLQQDGLIRATANFNNGLGTGPIIQLKPNTQYCLSFKQVGFENPDRNGNLRIDAVNASETNTTGTLGSVMIYSGTVYYSLPFKTSDTGKIHVSFGGSQNPSDVNAFKYILYDEVQIEEGAVATEYKPYTGVIAHAGDFGVAFSEKEAQKSKNLFYGTRNFHKGTSNGGYIEYSTNTQIYKLVAPGGGWLAELTPLANVKLLANKNYVLSCHVVSGTVDAPYKVAYVYFTDGSYKLLSIADRGYTNLRFDKDVELKHLTFDISSDVASNVNFKFQIEEGLVPTDWEPYNGEIMHSNDTPVAFAEAERLKTVNLFNPSDAVIGKGTYGYIPIKCDAPTYTLSLQNIRNSASTNTSIGVCKNPANANEGYLWCTTSAAGVVHQTVADVSITERPYIFFYPNTVETFKTILNAFDIQIEAGGSRTSYQPFNGKVIHESNLAEPLYDMYSTDPDINLGLPGGILFKADTASATIKKDKTKYRYLRFTLRLESDNRKFCYVVENNNTTQTRCMTACQADWHGDYVCLCGIVYAKEGQITAWAKSIGLSSSFTKIDYRDNSNYYISKIEGVY